MPEIKSSGILAFPAIDAKKDLKIYIEGSSDNYDLEFEPYVFSITATE